MSALASGSFDDTRRIALLSLDGALRQDLYNAEAFILSGATGFGLPPRTIVEENSPGIVGSWLRQVTVGPRELFLPIMLASDDGHDAYLQAKADLEAIVDPQPEPDYTQTDGGLLVQATSQRGGLRILPVVYEDGLEGDEGFTVSGAYWGTFGLKFRAVAPYWQAPADKAFQRTVGSGTVFLSRSSSDPWPRALSSAQILGQTMTIPVVSEVETWPVLEVVGPVTATSCTTSSGLNVSLPTGVPAGSGLRIITDPRRRSAQLFTVDGADNWTAPQEGWGLIGPGPAFAPLQPGDQGVTMAAPGATSSTRLRLRWRPLYRAAW